MESLSCKVYNDCVTHPAHEHLPRDVQYATGAGLMRSGGPGGRVGGAALALLEPREERVLQSLQT